MGKIFFKTDKLSVGYDGRVLIRDINIELERGRILTLIGPNGSGKSTILKSIARQLKKLSGCVYIGKKAGVGGIIQGVQYKADNDKINNIALSANENRINIKHAGLIDIEELSDRELAKTLSVVLTEKMNTDLLTCGDVTATGRYPYTGRLGILSAEDRRKAYESLKLVGLEALFDQDFMTLSDGQRQRVMLARAICQEPEIIVLDEPTSYLDIKHKLLLLTVLKEFVAVKGVTVIMSLHELELAQKVSDYVLCVKGEFIERYGTPEEIFKSDYIKELYDLDNGYYSEIFGSVELITAETEPEIFVIAGGGTGVRLFRRLQREGIPFSTGVLHENDVDYELARAMAVNVILERPFERIGQTAYDAACEEMRKCGRVICCVTEFGEMNERNRRLAEEAEAAGILCEDYAKLF